VSETLSKTFMIKYFSIVKHLLW